MIFNGGLIQYGVNPNKCLLIT